MASRPIHPTASATPRRCALQISRTDFMWQTLDNGKDKNQAPSQQPAANANNSLAAQLRTTAEQATIGRSLVIKGEVSGSEPLFIDGRVEGTINLSDNRVTIGRNGSVQANVTAK